MSSFGSPDTVPGSPLHRTPLPVRSFLPAYHGLLHYLSHHLPWYAACLTLPGWPYQVTTRLVVTLLITVLGPVGLHSAFTHHTCQPTHLHITIYVPYLHLPCVPFYTCHFCIPPLPTHFTTTHLTHTWHGGTIPVHCYVLDYSLPPPYTGPTGLRSPRYVCSFLFGYSLLRSHIYTCSGFYVYVVPLLRSHSRYGFVLVHRWVTFATTATVHFLPPFHRSPTPTPPTGSSPCHLSTFLALPYLPCNCIQVVISLLLIPWTTTAAMQPSFPHLYHRVVDLQVPFPVLPTHYSGTLCPRFDSLR